MRLVYYLIALIFILMIACDAFPLTNGNGFVNATVYGVTERDSINGDGIVYCIDMSADAGDKDSRHYYSVVLVDSEDRAYGPSLSEGAMANFNSANTVHLADLALNNYKFRDTVQLAVPKGTIIKRLRITPDDSDPFSIEWDGVPEVSAQGIKLQFYNGQSKRESDGKYTWTFDVKVTNIGNETVIAPGFSMKDESGWIYKGSSQRDRLLPGEALRFNVAFKDTGAFSHPSELIFNMTPPATFSGTPETQSRTYEDATMNIRAWV